MGRGAPPGEFAAVAAACAAAFAAGAAAGAVATRYLWPPPPPPQPKAISLAALQGLPTGGNASATPSVTSLSLPPTPGPATLNGGRSFGRSDSGGGAAAVADPRLRVVFVVRRDLRWQKQKLAVMVAHAALQLFKKLYKARNPTLAQWELAKGPKLVLRADDEAALLRVAEAARALGLPAHSIVEPDGAGGRTRSILALGPVPVDVLAGLAGGLVLL